MHHSERTYLEIWEIFLLDIITSSKQVISDFFFFLIDYRFEIWDTFFQSMTLIPISKD